jgi:hypothetical protein
MYANVTAVNAAAATDNRQNKNLSIAFSIPGTGPALCATSVFTARS